MLHGNGVQLVHVKETFKTAVEIYRGGGGGRMPLVPLVSSAPGFSQEMPLYFFYTMLQKSQKRPKSQIKGSCVNVYKRVSSWIICGCMIICDYDYPR